MKILKILTSVLLVALSLGACSKDEKDSPANLYQQYQVFLDNGMKSAHANLRLGSSTGARVQLAKGMSLVCNQLPMYYVVDDTYNYSASLPVNHNKAIFQLTLSGGKTLRNEVDFSNLPQISFISTAEEEKNRKVKLNLDGADVRNVTAYVISNKVNVAEDGTSSTLELPVSSEGTINVDALTGTRYEIYVDYVVNHPTIENDGTAKGNIQIVKRVRRIVSFASDAPDESE